jgi:hypothetical protein
MGGYMRLKRIIPPVLAMALVVLALTGSAVASTPTVTYTGQGFIDNGNGGFILKDERCGVGTQTPADDGSTGLFANWNGAGQPYQTGQGYLVWVLTLNASPAGGVTLDLPDGEHQMIKVGGTWKYASQYFSREALLAQPAHATYNGSSARVQLTVSHGCKPFEQEKPAWCSPGYWRNAADAAWAKTGHTRTESFNSTVVPSFYDTPYDAAHLFQIGNGPGATFITDPTLQQVLENPGGQNSTVSGPLGLNQFNATGAYLTDNIPGYTFSGDTTVDNCPLDNAGNFKTA